MEVTSYILGRAAARVFTEGEKKRSRTGTFADCRHRYDDLRDADLEFGVGCFQNWKRKELDKAIVSSIREQASMAFQVGNHKGVNVNQPSDLLLTTKQPQSKPVLRLMFSNVVCCTA